MKCNGSLILYYITVGTVLNTTVNSYILTFRGHEPELSLYIHIKCIYVERFSVIALDVSDFRKLFLTFDKLIFSSWDLTLNTMSLTSVPNAHKYNVHSFRRGGASFCFKSGVQGEVIQPLRNWKCDCHLRDRRFSLTS